MKMQFKSEFGRDKKPSSEAKNQRIQLRQFGQGMTEYIIIVALIALGSIGAARFFGHAVQGAFGGMASVLGGGTPAAGAGAATTAAGNAIAETSKDRTLATYAD